MGRSVLIVGCLLVLVSAIAIAAGGASSPGVLAQPADFDRTVFDVTVHENGTAEWVFEHRRVLDGEEEEADFRAYAETFESTETDLYGSFVNQTRTLAVVGTRETGREMAARDHAKSASVDTLGQVEGVVRMSFEWTNFAEDGGEEVVVADVFEGGLVLGEDQRIVFRTGEGVTFGRVQPAEYTPSGENLTASDSVTFFGPQEFADRRPRIEYRPVAGSGAGQPDGESNPVVVAALAAIALGAVIALGWRFDVLDRSDADSRAAPVSTSAPESPDLTSDSDQVVGLLEDNGGRMKQVDIVEETDWSKSKVSMLLSDMEDEGRITKLRVGRENIVSLEGEEPDAAGSPFEDLD